MTSLRISGVVLLLAVSSSVAAAPPEGAEPRRGLVARVWQKLRPGRAAAEGGHALTIRETWTKVKDEFQLYRGPRLERWSNKLAVGKTDFDASKPVSENLKALCAEKNLPHYYAEVGGRKVLHVVIDLAKGKETKAALRSVLRRVGEQTIELNYKASNAKNRYGHVAVRIGGGATYDLTGTRGVSELPKPLAKLLSALRGQSDLSFARKRNLRRFMESRREGPGLAPGLFYGMLFAATPGELAQTEKVYAERQKSMTGFNVGGGDAKQGIFSCAQFLTEDVPFLNQRGVGKTIGARSAASSARGSSSVEAVLVYRTPGVPDAELRNFQ